MRVVDSSELKKQVKESLIQELNTDRKHMRQGARNYIYRSVAVRERANFQTEDKGRKAIHGQRSCCNQTYSV